MKFSSKIVLTLGVLMILITSCTDKFEALNTDPNRPKDVTPGVLLGQMQYRIIINNVSASRNFTNELMQVDAPRSSTSGQGLHRYVVQPGQAVWSAYYDRLTDIQDIYNVSERLKENNYKAIALVYKSWAYSILTDL